MPRNRLRYTGTALLEVRVQMQLFGGNRTVGTDLYGLRRHQVNAGFYGSRCVKVALYSPHYTVPWHLQLALFYTCHEPWQVHWTVPLYSEPSLTWLALPLISELPLLPSLAQTIQSAPMAIHCLFGARKPLSRLLP